MSEHYDPIYYDLDKVTVERDEARVKLEQVTAICKTLIHTVEQCYEVFLDHGLAIESELVGFRAAIEKAKAVTDG